MSDSIKNIRMTLSAIIRSISQRTVRPPMYGRDYNFYDNCLDQGYTALNLDKLENGDDGETYSYTSVALEALVDYNGRDAGFPIRPDTAVIDLDFDAHQAACKAYRVGGRVTMDIVLSEDLSSARIESVRELGHNVKDFLLFGAEIRGTMAVWTDTNNTLQFDVTHCRTDSADIYYFAQSFAAKLNRTAYKATNTIENTKQVAFRLQLVPCTRPNSTIATFDDKTYAIIDESNALGAAISLKRSLVYLSVPGSKANISAVTDTICYAVDHLRDGLYDCKEDLIPKEAAEHSASTATLLDACIIDDTQTRRSIYVEDTDY